MHRLVASLLLLALLAGCGADVPEEPPTPTTEAADEHEEGWRVHEAEPEADEDHPGSVLLTRRAEADGPAGSRARLVLGCEEGQTQAYVEWGTPLGGAAADLPVSYRLDDTPPVITRWPVSGDREAVGLWDDGASIAFIRALLGRDRLTVEVTPPGEGPLTSAFALGGLDSLVVPVRERCSWA